MRIEISIDIDIDEVADLAKLFNLAEGAVLREVVHQVDVAKQALVVAQEQAVPDEDEGQERGKEPPKEKQPREKQPRPVKKQGVARLSFAEFDPLVRAEMKRLSLDKRMPGYKLWDSERDQRLPTLGGVMARYEKTRMADLAEVFGMQPPLDGRINADR